MQPLITIITVVYNGEKQIEYTIKSILNLQYENIEYIIIDGGSTDNTIGIIKKYENKISKWISEVDNGIYDAMNKAVRLSTGDWVIFMNAGDLFYNSEVLNFIDFDNKYDVIYGSTNVLLEKANYILSSKPLTQVKKKMIFCHQSVFVKKDILLKYPFDLKYKIAADYNLFYALYMAGYTFNKVNQCISSFDARSGLSSNNISLLLKENYMINKRYFEYKFSLIRVKFSNIIKNNVPRMYPFYLKFKERLLKLCKRI